MDVANHLPGEAKGAMQLVVDVPQTSLKPGDRTLFGCEVVSFLGEGAGAAIYAVRDPKSGQQYALKHVIRKDEKHQRYIDQLVNEHDVSNRLEHANVRRTIEVKTKRTLLLQVAEAALLMELLDAIPLDAAMGNFGPGGTAPLPWTVSVMVQAARGLAAINSAGYVHCDMKPGNIMVPNGTNSIVKVIDLGQACVSGTVKKRIQGSPHFISPEQFKLEPVTFRTDVFNFGATLYWAITGQNVPTHYTRAKGLAKGRAEDATTPRELRPEVPRELSDLTMECVRSRVLERPETMSAVANRLGLILRGSDLNAAVA